MDLNPRLFSFIGGEKGKWKITQSKTIAGESLPIAARLDIVSGYPTDSSDTTWTLHGVTSNERYVTREEKEVLLSKQPILGRPDAVCGVLIPIRKNAQWWLLTQDERRKIFEEHSHHNATGVEYLPAIARRLHHCRDLTNPEPFDFLTWFEFAEKDTQAFDQLLERLRATEEWKYVDREVEIRLMREL